MHTGWAIATLCSILFTPIGFILLGGKHQSPPPRKRVRPYKSASDSR